MIVVVIVCLLAVVGLAVALWRFQQHIDELTAERDALVSELDAADNEVTEALAATVAAEKARDDALERVQRGRRDAAEVAKRLADESAARLAAETRLVEVVGELEAAGPAVDVDRLWALALADVERTWRMSVASGPDDVSPLGDSDHPLRTAVEIEVDAAREEAGAAIELEWQVEAAVAPAEGVLVLATVRQLIASVAKTASSAVLMVTSTDGGVEVCVDARDDDDAPIVIDLAGMTG